MNARERYLSDPQYADKVDRQLATVIKHILSNPSATSQEKEAAEHLLEKCSGLKDLLD